ncbi:MAG: histidine kinase dimerization/phospho-acceptor domain-containing protein, partial [Bacteroidota bacterium]
GDQLGVERWGFLSNSYIIGILVVLFGILQERRSQRDFLLRKKIELREAQLSIKTTELEALNKSLESFSYSVSHDLRGPIRNMIGLSTLLQRKKNGDEEIQEITDTIVFNAHKMNQLVEDILSFAKASNAPINSRELNMTQLFEDAYAELREENDKREIHFELDPLKAANGDPSLIRQVVLNLLSNALKYTRQRAETHICVKGMEQEDGKYLYLVQDNGTGFDENRKAELFQPFKLSVFMKTLSLKVMGWDLLSVKRS